MRGTATAVFVAVLLAIASSATAAEVDYLVSPQSLADGKPEFSPPHGAGTNPFGYDWDSAAPDTVSGGAPAYGTSSFYANVVNSSDGSSPDASSYRTLRLGMRTLFGKNVTVGQLAQLSYYTRKPAPATAIDWRPSIYTTVQAGDGNSSSWYRSRLQARPSSSLNLNAPENAWNQWNTSAGTNQLVFYDNSTARKAAFGSSSLTWDLIAGGEVTGNGGATWDFSSEEIMMIDLTLGANSGGGTGESQIDGVRIELTTGEIADIDLGTVLYVNGSGNNCYGSGAAFTTIQAAIAAASAGDTIMICPGTYVETGQLLIDKDLTIQGAGADSTIVQSTTNTSGGSYDPSAGWWLVTAGNTLTLKGVRLDGTGRAIDSAIQSRGNLAVEDCDFRNIRRSTYVGRAIVLLTGTSTIKNCTFSNIQRIGVHVRGAVLSPLPVATVENCTYTGKGSVDGLDYAVEFGAGGSGTVLNCSISNCTAVASSDQSTSAGVLATDYYGLGTHATVTGSTFFNCSKGIHVGYVTDTHLVDETLLTANNNNFTGSGVETGVRNVATAQVNAENNWWGTANGPGPVGPGSGDRVSDNVDYDPWLTKPAQSNVVYLVPTDDSVYVKPSETVVVDLNVANLTQPVTALQAMLNFSSNFFRAGANEVSVAPGGGVWDDLIYNVWTVGGDLDIAVGVELEQASAGTNVDAKTAYMTLNPAGPEGITQVVFRPDAVPDEYLTQSTILADASGQAVWPAKVNSTNIYIDGTPPVITCPPDVTVNTDPGTCVATNVVLGTPVVADSLSGVDTLTNDAPATYPHGETIVTWTATDRAGNVATCTQKVTVTDQEAPAIICPAEVTLECSELTGIAIDGVKGTGEWDGAQQITAAGGKGTIALKADRDYLYVLFDLADTTDARTTYPNERGNDEIGLNINPTSGGSWGYPYALIFQTSAPAPHQMPWNPKVSSGDTADGWVSRLLVNDVQISLPADLLTATTYNPNRISEWRIPLSLVGSALGQAIQVGGALDIGDGGSYVFPVGLNWSDASTFASYTLSVSYASGTATATDNCDPATITYSDSEAPGSCGQAKVITRTWTATDASSNLSTCMQTINVVDTTAPVLTVPPTATVECSDPTGIVIDGVKSSGEWDGAQQIPVASSMGSVSLKSDADYLYVLLDLVDTTDDRLGQNLHGNDQVGLNIDPTDGNAWGHPYGLILQTGSDPGAWGGASSGVTDGWESQLKVNDVVQPLPADLLTATIYNPTRVSEWRIPLSLLAPKALGDSIRVGGAVDVGDQNSYVYPLGLNWSSAATFVEYALAVSYSGGAAIATDNCDPAPVITYTDAVTPGNCGEVTVTRTWTATDACGNSTSADQIIQVVDTTDPAVSITSAQQGGQELLGSGAPAAVQGAVVITVTGSDNCCLLAPVVKVTDAASVETTLTAVPGAPGTWTYTYTVGPATANGVATITATLDDGAGNTATDTDTFVVDKNQVAGEVELESYAGSSRAVTFVATDGSGAVLKSWTLTLSFSSGVADYVLTLVPANTANLSAKTAWSLRNKLACAPDANGQAAVNFTGAEKLLGGDINGSNSINVLDYSILKTNWFSHNVVADITGDGDVNMTDYSVLKTNWFKVGDEQ